MARGGKRRIGWLAAAAVAVVVLACERHQPPLADAAVSIDGERLPYGQFEAYLEEYAGAGESDLGDEVKSRLFDQFLDEQLLIRLAIERGLEVPVDEGAAGGEAAIEPRRAIAFLIEERPPPAWDETEMRAYYEEHRGELRRPEEVHLRQILVQERERAEEALAELGRGEDFARVAARFSEGPRAQAGGDQGRLSREDLPPALVEVIFALAPGETSGVVDAGYGFHIFQVVARYPAEEIPYGEARDEIRRALERRHDDRLLDELVREARQRYDVEIFPQNFPFDYRGPYAS